MKKNMKFCAPQKTITKNILFTAAMLGIATFFAFLLFYNVPENMANVALIYIVFLIIITRNTDSRWYGIVSSICCVFFINYFFMYPYFGFNFTITGYPITLIEILSISLITSTMTSSIIRQSKTLVEQERTLLESEKERMRANLLRAISHDLRTPLASIINTASMCTDTHIDITKEDQRKMISHIEEDAVWLLNMVDNLLSVTRIQEEGATIVKKPESVEEVVSEAVIRLKKRIPDAAITVSVPDVFLMLPMDATLIEQVIINLLENACVHSMSTLSTELTVLEKPAGISFHVRDYGVGINKEELDLLLEGKFMPGAQSADGRRGMGIGLSICRTIIAAHGGTMATEQHADGSEFIFTLPKED